MYFVRIIDSNGFFLRDDNVEELTEFTITAPIPSGMYAVPGVSPQWDGEKWVQTAEPPEPTAEDAALAEKQEKVNVLIDGGECTLPDELHRQCSLASTANDSLTALYDYLAQCFPEQFGS